VPHPTRNTAAYVAPISEQLKSRPRRFTQLQYECYCIAREMIGLVDPDYASGEYIVQFAYMNSKAHYVKVHTDNHDISYQYVLTLGDFAGASLRAYLSKDRSSYLDFATIGSFVKVDGRHPHEVILSPNFRGDRFTCIWYKNYDRRKRRDDAILKTPYVVNEAML